MNQKLKLFNPLFYAQSIKRSPGAAAYYKRVLEGEAGKEPEMRQLTTHQIKRTFYVLEDWAHLLSITTEEEKDLRIRFLDLSLKRHDFKYDQVVDDINGFTKFFNLLVSFSYGSPNAISELERIVLVDKRMNTYEIVW